MEVYVVTMPELGWDCVCGVFKSLKSAEEYTEGKDGYIIHEQIIQ